MRSPRSGSILRLEAPMGPFMIETVGAWLCLLTNTRTVATPVAFSPRSHPSVTFATQSKGSSRTDAWISTAPAYFGAAANQRSASSRFRCALVPRNVCVESRCKISIQNFDGRRRGDVERQAARLPRNYRQFKSEHVIISVKNGKGLGPALALRRSAGSKTPVQANRAAPRGIVQRLAQRRQRAAAGVQTHSVHIHGVSRSIKHGFRVRARAVRRPQSGRDGRLDAAIHLVGGVRRARDVEQLVIQQSQVSR